MSQADSHLAAPAACHDHYAEIAPRLHGSHIFHPDLEIAEDADPEQFAAPEELRAETKRRLAAAGIEVIADNGITLTVGLSAQQMDDLRRESPPTTSATAPDDRQNFASALETTLETTYGGLAVMPEMAPPGCSTEPLISPHPPQVSYPHLVALPISLITRGLFT